MQATAAILLLVMSGNMQPAMAQTAAATGGSTQQKDPDGPAAQPATGADQSNLPSMPAPKLTEPLYLRDTGRDYTQQHPFWFPIR